MVPLPIKHTKAPSTHQLKEQQKEDDNKKKGTCFKPSSPQL